jgi:hypothetical protein
MEPGAGSQTWHCWGSSPGRCGGMLQEVLQQRVVVGHKARAWRRRVRNLPQRGGVILGCLRQQRRLRESLGDSTGGEPCSTLAVMGTSDEQPWMLRSLAAHLCISGAAQQHGALIIVQARLASHAPQQGRCIAVAVRPLIPRRQLVGAVPSPCFGLWRLPKHNHLRAHNT